VSRRNNLERTGAPQPDAPTPPIQQTNDLFSFVTPTEFVVLPSAGALYPEGHPLRDQEAVEIRHMTAKEEDILTSETLLKRGLAIDRLVNSVMVDKSIKVDDLLVGDKNAILLASRITGFGPLYEVSITCPSCATQQEKEFDLSTIEIKETDLSEVEATDRGTYKFELPVTKVMLEIRLLKSSDERTISKNNEQRKKKKLPENNTTTLLSSIMVSANDVEDRSQLLRFAELMPVRDSQYVRTLYDKIKPDIDMRFDFVCSNCEHDGKVVMPLTAEFFWPNS
jgi:hypothetical protein